TWIYDVLKSYFRAVQPEVPVEFRKNKKNPGIIDLSNESALSWLKQLKGNFIFKSHSFPPSDFEGPPKVKFVTVIRDPRDIMVSSIHYLANLDPEFGGW